jgi:hypothetical protein
MPDQSDDTPRRRDRVRATARRVAPYAVAVLAGGAVVTVAVLTGRKAAPSLVAVDLPKLPSPSSTSAPSLPRQSPVAHIVSEHMRNGRTIAAYERGRPVAAIS